MNKEKIKEFMPLMQAMLEGKTIQHTDLDTGEWVDVEEIYCGEDVLNYRIKPESKYRPFKDAEECWAEMQKHQPVGWTKLIGGIEYSFITDVNDTIRFSEDIKEYIFVDGTPFGIKEEE